MHWARRHHHTAAWSVLLVMLVMAIAPAMSQWMRSGDTRWVEVCSSFGARWVQLDAATGDVLSSTEAQSRTGGAPGGDSGFYAHCPWCQLQAHGAALPPSLVALDLLPLQYAAPALFLQAPATLAVWRTQWARGPPALA
jgi:hypothetical protein